MEFMPLIPFLGESVPASLALYYLVLVLTGKKESPLFIIILSLLTSLFSFAIRSIPMVFGIHSILQVVLMVIFLNLFFQLPWHTATVVMILTSVVLGLLEGIFVPFLAWVFSMNLQQIISDPLLRILFTLPHLLLLAALTHIISRHRWRLPLILRFKEINCETAKKTKVQFIKQTYLFALCLVEALVLVVLRMSYYTYTSGVYPSFTLDTLVRISLLVLMVAAIATIFVAVYLLKVIERNTKLETELCFVREKHNLDLRLQVERHDFNNHLTAIYGYIKAGQYTQTKAYIENLYNTVSHIGSLLKIDSPELSAILSVKQEEAKAKGIEFNWQVNIQSSTLPLSPEDITHLTGNLLGNAMDAAQTNCSPIVDFTLTCNKLGLKLKISNNCSLIHQNIKQNIFAAGFTTKDTNQHSGLGLYIIKQIVDCHDGQLELKEPENYSGVEFAIYIPWNK